MSLTSVELKHLLKLFALLNWGLSGESANYWSCKPLPTAALSCSFPSRFIPGLFSLWTLTAPHLEVVLYLTCSKDLCDFKLPFLILCFCYEGYLDVFVSCKVVLKQKQWYLSSREVCTVRRYLNIICPVWVIVTLCVQFGICLRWHFFRLFQFFPWIVKAL